MPETGMNTARNGRSGGFYWAIFLVLGLLGGFLVIRSVQDAKTEVLLKSYVDSDEAGRAGIARAVASRGDRGIARVVAMAAERDGLRPILPDLLGRMPPETLGEETFEVGADLLQGSSPPEHVAGMSVMTALGPKAVPWLEALLLAGAGGEVAERYLAAPLDAGETGEAAVVSYYVGFFQHSDRDLRKDAAERLALMGRTATPGLLEALGDPEATVRLFAATTLGAIRDDRSVLALVEALQHEEDLGVQVAVGSTLWGITGEEALAHDAAGWKAYFDANRAAFPAQVLPDWVE